MKEGNVGSIPRRRTVLFAWGIAKLLILKNHQQLKVEDSWVYLQGPIFKKIKCIGEIFIKKIK